VAAAVRAIIERLQVELKVIEKTGFLSYFLIVGISFATGTSGVCVQCARLGGWFDRYLSFGDLQRLPDPLRIALRAVPQSRARQSAGY